jgi:protein-arginine kinase activator protein McsA
MNTCDQCLLELVGIYEETRGTCDNCYSEVYAKEAIADALTEEPVNELYE